MITVLTGVQSAIGGGVILAMTMLAFGLHIGGGALGLVSGTVAIIARKGGRLHRSAGKVFFGSMLVMAAFAAYLGLAIPGQIANVFGGAFVFYLVVTAWLTVRRREGEVGLPEKIALGFILCLCLPFAILSFQVASGAAPHFKGPLLIAIYTLTLVVFVAAIGDAGMVLGGGVSGAARIARHLWRMCLGLAMATGSAFTNGFARLLPGHYHVPLAFFLPQFVPVGLLVFWMIRVRLSGGRWRDAAAY